MGKTECRGWFAKSSSKYYNAETLLVSQQLAPKASSYRSFREHNITKQKCRKTNATPRDEIK
jgi:hypothetical protein